VTELDMPLTPMRVWQAIQAAGNGGRPGAGSGPAIPPEGGAA
jgi:hypothetical protein